MHHAAPQNDPDTVAAVREALTSLRQHSASLSYASVLTDDGFEVASEQGLVSTGTGRFASIASSLQALGEAAVRELQLGGASSVLVFSEHGHIVQVRVEGTTLVLAALFGSGETIGHALALARRAASELGARVPRSVPQ